MGPILVQVAWTLVQARTEGRVPDVAETLVVFRERQGDGSWKHDYLLSNASLLTPVEEFARVFKVQHRIEECLQRPREKRVWRAKRCGRGLVGITTRRWR